MLLNFTNHPSKDWSDKQIKAAEKEYGTVKDIEFPSIIPAASSNDVCKLAKEYVSICINEIRNTSEINNAVHIMGESTFCFSLTAMLIKKGVKCIASTTERNTKILDDGREIRVFEFIGFREYVL